MLALHGIAFLQPTKPTTVPQTLFPSIFKAASHRTMSEIYLLSSKGSVYIQSKCSTQVFRQWEGLDLGRLRKESLRLEAACFSFSSKREGHTVWFSSCSGMLWQSACLRSTARWADGLSTQYLVSELGNSPVQRVSDSTEVQSHRTGRSKVNIKIIHSKTP